MKSRWDLFWVGWNSPRTKLHADKSAHVFRFVSISISANFPDRQTNRQTLSFVCLFITVNDYVWFCMNMYDYLWLCDDYLWHCMTMYGYAWLCMTDMEIILALLGTLEYRSNSYCEVRYKVFVLDYNIIVKALQGLSQSNQASP